MSGRLLWLAGGTAFAGRPEKVIGALIFAPSSMPTPKRPVNSPPSQPVPPNRAAPRNDRMYARTDGLTGADLEKLSQEAALAAVRDFLALERGQDTSKFEIAERHYRRGLSTITGAGRH